MFIKRSFIKRLLVKRSLVGMLLAVAIGQTARAGTIVFEASPSGTGNNVLFNLQPAKQTGNPILGNVNDDSHTLVQFASNETLISPSGGQARIEAQDGSLHQLTVTLPGLAGFDSAVFNLNAARGTGSATITVVDQFGMSEQFNLSLGPGQNFFTLTTDDIQYMTSVSISTTLGLDDVRQVRIAAVPGTEVRIAAVPGPVAGSGLAAVVMSLGALALLASRRRTPRKLI